MKERPILFNAEMVRAIMDGRKAVTRRPIKYPEQSMIEYFDGIAMFEDQFGDHFRVSELYNPFGQIGDLLYVRETWCKIASGYIYKADDSIFETSPMFKWKPSIHMPKEATRIWLEITDIRVERVHDLTEKDAFYEGFERKNNISSKDRFLSTMNNIYGNIEQNPWVWVVEFKRIDK